MLLCAATACRKEEIVSPQVAAARVDPTPVVIYVVVTPTEGPWTPIPFESVATPIIQTAEQVFKVAPAPTVDIASIPNADRPKEPTPTDLHDQMVRCLSYTVEVPQDYAAINTRHGVHAFVHAKNSCDNVSFDGGECWFEIHSRDKSGSVLSKEVGRFQSPIRANGDAQTEIDIVTGWGEKLDASIWWAAGGGRGRQ